MLDLFETRDKIDEVDNQIIQLYLKRMKLCEDVVKYKIENNRQIFDKERENRKIEKAVSMVDREFDKRAISEIFEQLMSISRKMQYRIMSEKMGTAKSSFIEIYKLNTKDAKVVFQGTEGAYSQIAMHRFFGEDVNSISVATFREAMETLEAGFADYAVIPIENSSAGIVNECYDLLVEFENFIVGEQIIDVEHALLGTEDSTIEDINEVYSHPQALMQCEKYLDDHKGWIKYSELNTAIAAKKIKEGNDKTKAAIASVEAAKLYGLKILDERINYSSINSTRFVIISSQKVFLKNANTISICFELPHESGSLYHVLSHFIYNNLNMTRIESRPLKERNWEYRFFIDFEGSLVDESVKNAIRGLREETKQLRILGNY